MVKSKAISTPRDEAVLYARLVNRFLKPEVFPKVMKAIKKHNEEGVKDFGAICIELKIPKKKIPMCIATAFAVAPDYFDLPAPGTKTSRPATTQQLW